MLLSTHLFFPMSHRPRWQAKAAADAIGYCVWLRNVLFEHYLTEPLSSVRFHMHLFHVDSSLSPADTLLSELLYKTAFMLKW